MSEVNPSKTEAKILLLQQTNQYFIDTVNTYKKAVYTPSSFSHTNIASLAGGVNTGPCSDQWNAQESYYLSLREFFFK